MASMLGDVLVDLDDADYTVLLVRLLASHANHVVALLVNPLLEKHFLQVEALILWIGHYPEVLENFEVKWSQFLPKG
jgi:hypothetical protein